jgi:hypothetical protein
MRRTSLWIAAALLLLPSAGHAADMPAIKVSDRNKVPECVTPGRLAAFLRDRNSALDPRFEKISVEYMRRGEELGLRWDYTFYQMALETGYLSFKGDRGRRGDVRSSQNNFAGLGATGGGVSGESFPDVATGVLAHLQHVLIYAGETVENPVAERTRKVQEWGILKSLKKSAKGEITFAHLATRWAPGADYVSNLQSISRRFHDQFCNAPDPHPEWVALARGTTPKVAAVDAPKIEKPDRNLGAELARRAIEIGKEEGDDRRKGLGAAAIAARAPTPSYSILNAPQAAAPGEAEPAPQASAPAATPPAPPAASATATAAPGASPAAKGRADRRRPAVTASAAGAIAKAQPAQPAPPAQPGKGETADAANAKCRVFTASYGGLKALIIRVKAGDGVDYTVLDVNEGAEKREAEAYIAAYAKSGEIAGEYQSQTQALEKAFELCPES